jgi:hypothetical protein
MSAIPAPFLPEGCAFRATAARLYTQIRACPTPWTVAVSPKWAQIGGMRYRLVLLTALLGSCAAPPPPGVPQPLAELTGRTAGPAKDCVPIRQSENLRIADDRSTLIYGSGTTIWVNALGPSCHFGFNDIPIFEPTVSSYCRGDIVRTVDRDSHIPGPSCVLGPFVAFTRP